MTDTISEDDASLDIAVVGMAGRFPGAESVPQLWANLLAGRCAAVDTGAGTADGFVPVAYPMAGSDGFDATFFGIAPREAELMDPQHRVLLECAWAAVESAGLAPSTYPGPVGVYVGGGYNTYLLRNVGTQPGAGELTLDKATLLGNRSDFLASRVAYKLGLRGPAVNVQTACSTSLVAVVEACQALLAYQCDAALAGGVAVDDTRARGYRYHPDGILSPDGRTRTFDADARGTTGGDGVGLVVLKRLSDAVADRDHVHAVIRGTAVNNDGSARAGFTAPAAAAQSEVIASALAAAGLAPDTIGYVELHGTATPLGDPVEFAALRTAFGGVASGRCLLGSVKTNVGHLDAAAGVTGLIKTVLAVEHGTVPASLHFERPNPRIPLDGSPFAMATETLPWPGDGPRRAGVSSFGLGGTNAHVVLEQAPGPPAGPSDGDELLVLSARSADALEAMTRRLHDHLDLHPDVALADVADTLRTGRETLPYRRAVVVTGRVDAVHALSHPEEGRVLSGYTGSAAGRPVGFVYSGFGAQHRGMARDLYTGEPVFRAALDECAELLDEDLGRQLREVVLADSGRDAFAAMLDPRGRGDDPLDGPLLGYPATFALGWALTRLWQARGVSPAVMIGHSLGETVAACVAGVFRLPDAVRLVVARARLIEQCGPGAMLAVELGEDAATAHTGPEVSLAAVNGPATCVLSGTVDGIGAVRERLASAEVPHRLLGAGFAFHSPMMDPVVDRFRELVAAVELRAPGIPFVSNITGTWITDAQATDPGYWAEHLRHPVRFADGVATVLAVPGVTLVEVGAAPTLTSGVLRHPAAEGTDRVCVPSLPGPLPGRTARGAMHSAAARLWLAGADTPFTRQDGTRRTALPTYPFERTRFWLEPGESRAAPDAAHRRGPGSSWYWTPSWTRLPAPAPVDTTGLADARWLVLADDTGPGHDLAARLRGLGATVRTVVPPGATRAGDDVLDPADPGAATDLVVRLRPGGVPDRLLHCWSSGAPGAAGAVEWQRGPDTLLGLARAYDAELMTGAWRWDVVTTGACAVLGDEALVPERAALRGVVRVLGQEYPSLTCVHHDVPASGTEVGALLDALADDGTRTAARRGSHRWAPVFVAADPAPAAEPAVVAGGTYLVTGGLGRIGLVVARALAERAPVRLVLTGRRGAPVDRDAPAAGALRELAALGAEVETPALDVTDAAGMRALVARLGRVDGVVHCAGTTGPDAHRAVGETGPDDIARHLGPKVRGVRVLHEALEGQSLRFALICSSVASVLGGLGFGAYAAANAALDAFAHANHDTGRPWTSVNWEAWLFPGTGRTSGTGGTVGAAVQELALTPDEGRAVVDRLLDSTPCPQVAISTGDLNRRERQWATPAAPAPAPARHRRPALRNPYVVPEGAVEERIAGIWQELLGVSDVGAHDNFFELGGSSLLGLQVVHRLRGELAAPLPLTVVYEGPTVRTLAALVREPETAG
ncbi:type I polyketide synthase [Actinophytocola oryzae]|uniref:Acyl transferase domain-containing protein n=1 Tax=Actinophytocola oryzae TaxID=502181 RepID=A0A4R7VK20_9PSEU|nr:type I polyketide synthase [Actinophytocola oryzae]TDV49792.1 acyl transferase domain-containing protein [Actinophytocola oryzae]